MGGSLPVKPGVSAACVYVGRGAGPRRSEEVVLRARLARSVGRSPFAYPGYSCEQHFGVGAVGGHTDSLSQLPDKHAFGVNRVVEQHLAPKAVGTVRGEVIDKPVKTSVDLPKRPNNDRKDSPVRLQPSLHRAHTISSRSEICHVDSACFIPVPPRDGTRSLITRR